MEIFAYILALIWSILCLILFFKILGMTNNVEQLAQEVHELRMVLVQEQTKAKGVVSKEQEEISLVQSPSDIPCDDLYIGDKVKLKSNGKLYKVVDIEENGNVRCRPEKIGIFDKFVSVKGSDLIKV